MFFTYKIRNKDVKNINYNKLKYLYEYIKQNLIINKNLKYNIKIILIDNYIKILIKYKKKIRSIKYYFNDFNIKNTFKKNIKHQRLQKQLEDTSIKYNDKINYKINKININNNNQDIKVIILKKKKKYTLNNIIIEFKKKNNDKNINYYHYKFLTSKNQETCLNNIINLLNINYQDIHAYKNIKIIKKNIFFSKNLTLNNALLCKKNNMINIRLNVEPIQKYKIKYKSKIKNIKNKIILNSKIKFIIKHLFCNNDNNIYSLYNKIYHNNIKNNNKYKYKILIKNVILLSNQIQNNKIKYIIISHINYPKNNKKYLFKLLTIKLNKNKNNNLRLYTTYIYANYNNIKKKIKKYNILYQTKYINIIDAYQLKKTLNLKLKLCKLNKYLSLYINLINNKTLSLYYKKINTKNFFKTKIKFIKNIFLNKNIKSKLILNYNNNYYPYNYISILKKEKNYIDNLYENNNQTINLGINNKYTLKNNYFHYGCMFKINNIFKIKNIMNTILLNHNVTITQGLFIKFNIKKFVLQANIGFKNNNVKNNHLTFNKKKILKRKFYNNINIEYLF